MSACIYSLLLVPCHYNWMSDEQNNKFGPTLLLPPLLKAFVVFAISFYINRLYFYPMCALGAMAHIYYYDVSIRRKSMLCIHSHVTTEGLNLIVFVLLHSQIFHELSV